MNKRLMLEIFTIEIWHIFAIIISVMVFVLLYMKTVRTASLKAFLYVEINMILWMIAKVLKTVSPTVEIRWGFVVFQYLAICLLEASFLEFSYAYYRGKVFSMKTRVLVHILPLLQFVVVATNPLHYLFYAHFDFRGDSFGPLFYLHFAIEYLYIAIGIFFCIQVFREKFRHKNIIYTLFIALSISAPILFNTLYVTRILGDIFRRYQWVIFDVTPIIFSWSLLLFVYVTSKNEFFSMLPIMRHRIIYQLNVPLCILDSAGDLLFQNEMFRKAFGSPPLMRQVRQSFFEFRKRESKEGLAAYERLFSHKEKTYRLQVKPLKSFIQLHYIFVLFDITSYVEAKESLLAQNQLIDIANQKLSQRIDLIRETSKIHARNYVARELHDIVGHSLVVAIKLLEVAQIETKKKARGGDASLKKALDCLFHGASQMKAMQVQKSIGDGKPRGGPWLKERLTQLMDQLKDAGIQAKLYIKEEEAFVAPIIAEEIQKIAMELSTNAMKHARARHMIFSLSLGRDIYFRVMDDGVGCKNLEKGNGLRGIESRVGSLGGHIDYEMDSEMGFVVNLCISQKGI